MATVIGKVAGGAPREFTVGTVGDLRAQLHLEGKYAASVNGTPKDDSYVLKDDEYVSFAPQSKGGSR